MIVRASKIILLAALAFNITIVVLNNIFDYNSNFIFLSHVLSMDTTFPGNSLMWRAITSPAIQTVFYITIIAWETSIAVMLWMGTFRCYRAIKSKADEFNASKKTAVAGLTLSILLWLTAFITVGGEWFVMWQSSQWNGEFPALKYLMITGIILLFLNTDDKEISKK